MLALEGGSQLWSWGSGVSTTWTLAAKANYQMCELTIKQAECQRIDAFQMWCWRRLLRVPWTARRSNQSILKEISPGCSLEGLMLKLKLRAFLMAQMVKRLPAIWETGV